MRDTTGENREYWKNEMAQALREIQAAYDEKLGMMRNDMETFYNLKVTWQTPPSVLQNFIITPCPMNG